MRFTAHTLLALLLGTVLTLSTSGNATAAPRTTRVSVSSTGVEGNSHSIDSGISSDGRFVVFASFAANLLSVPDTNSALDIFIHDRQTGNTTLISAAPDGTLANGPSYAPRITPDGRFIVFFSTASNLVTGDSNNKNDVFVHDRQTGLTSRVSISSTGVQSDGDSYYCSISDDGRHIVFGSNATNLDAVFSDTNGLQDIFIHDRQDATTTLISKNTDNIIGNDRSVYPVISGNGQFAVFYSKATNFVSNSDVNGSYDIFIRDLQTGSIRLVSITPDGMAGNYYSTIPAISTDGQTVVFRSDASDLVANDTNNKSDIFVRDLATNQTTKISLDPGGNEHPNGSLFPSLSADGMVVGYYASGADAVDNVYRHDRRTGKTTLVSVTSSGAPGTAHSRQPAVSADGNFIAFQSKASDLVANDTNGADDIFVRGSFSDFPWTMFLPAITGNK